MIIVPNKRKNYCCHCSVAKSCLTLCHPVDCSMPSFPFLYYHPEFAQIHVHWLRQWYLPTISSSVTLFSSCPQFSPALGSFPVSQLFVSDGQSTGASASGWVPPVNIQGWFPLGLIGLISLMSQGLSRVFSSTTIWKYQFFSAHGNPFQYSCLENSVDREAWQATVHGVTMSRTWLSD